MHKLTQKSRKLSQLPALIAAPAPSFGRVMKKSSLWEKRLKIANEAESRRGPVSTRVFPLCGNSNPF